jgi:polar amino acid transport system permease protein
MQLFLTFFGLPILFGVEVSAWTAATVALTGFASAFLADIWRGCLQSIPVGQWEAGKALGLRFILTLALIVVPQAIRLAIPPTVGFSVQVVKGTALAYIVGFIELTKTGVGLNNVTFQPLLIFSLVSFIYLSICFPVSWLSRRLERRLL